MVKKRKIFTGIKEKIAVKRYRLEKIRSEARRAEAERSGRGYTFMGKTIGAPKRMEYTEKRIEIPEYGQIEEREYKKEVVVEPSEARKRLEYARAAGAGAAKAIGGRLAAEAKAIGARRVSYEKAERFFVARSKPKRKVRLRYAPAARNILYGGTAYDPGMY